LDKGCTWPRRKITVQDLPHSTGKTRGEYEDFVTGFVTPEGKV
jgi:hypothetical protein